MEDLESWKLEQSLIKLPNLEEEKDIFFGLGGEIQKSF